MGGPIEWLCLNASNINPVYNLLRLRKREGALDMSTLAVFDRGAWRDVLVSNAFAQALDDFQENVRETDQMTENSPPKAAPL